MIYVSADGACRAGGYGSWAYVITRSTAARDVEVLAAASGLVEDTTNQRMEILAVTHGLEAAARLFTDEAVTVVSDSAYVINCFREKWFVKWFANNWMTERGPVANQDAWQLLFDVVGWLNSRREPMDLVLHPVVWQHVKGHAGHPTNELCDELCMEVLDRWAN